MNIIEKNIKDIIPYEKNPRNNEEAIKYVANSIKEFGFKVPVIIDKNNIIVAGHTRVLAAKELKLKTVPCVVADDLTDEQVKAFRLADNKVAEYSGWDFDLLNEELSGILDIDMAEFGFNNISEDAISYIDDLLENEYAEHKVEQTQFSMTFVFDNEYKNDLEDYIKANGKEKIVALIIEEVKNA